MFPEVTVRLTGVFSIVLDNSRSLWHKRIEQVLGCKACLCSFSLFMGFVENKKSTRQPHPVMADCHTLQWTCSDSRVC